MLVRPGIQADLLLVLLLPHRLLPLEAAEQRQQQGRMEWCPVLLLPPLLLWRALLLSLPQGRTSDR